MQFVKRMEGTSVGETEHFQVECTANAISLLFFRKRKHTQEQQSALINSLRHLFRDSDS